MSATHGGSSKTSKPRKRKNHNQQEGSRKRQKNTDLPLSERLPRHGFPSDHPFNKDGYRYCLAEPDPHIPDNDPEPDYAKPIPPKTYRILQHPIPLLSANDRAPQLHLSDDRMTIKGEKGYSMVRGTHGVRKGDWYYEIELLSLPTINDSTVRVGFAQACADVQCPLGYDEFGYSIRSKKGTVFHKSKGKSYMKNKEGFVEGDIIGCHIYLNPENDAAKQLPDTLKEATLVKFKNFNYFESLDHKKKIKANLKPGKGNKIQFYKNGKPLGVAFEEINDGVYYPAVSLFKSAKIRANFGPKWKKPPENGQKFEPITDQGFKGEIEQAMADLLFAVDLKINGII